MAEQEERFGPGTGQNDFANDAETIMAPGLIPANRPKPVTPPPIAEFDERQGAHNASAENRPHNPWAPAPTGEQPTFDSQSYSRPVAPGVVVDSVSAVPTPIFEQVVEPAVTTDSASFSNIVDKEDFDRTVMSSRKNPSWILETSAGQTVPLTGTSAILGRKPTNSEHLPASQLIILEEPGKTVSKTHARLDFVRGQWIITDLNSSNGVVLIDADGSEQELRFGASSPIAQKILLGDLYLSLAPAS